MEPVSGMSSSAIRLPSTVAGVKAPPKVQQSDDKTRDGPIAPARDEYIPEEKREASGLYWLGKDEDGKPRAYFDGPEWAAGTPEKQDELPAADGPDQDKGAPEKKASGDKAESSACNTDKVDREIEKLKKKQEELKRQINSETDDTKIEELEKKLAQVEGELRLKDNDAYRRRHAAFS